MTIQADFVELENKFLQCKDTQNKHCLIDLIEQIQQSIDNYRHVLDIPDQITLAHIFELQLALYLLTEQKDKATAIEKILNEEFLGIHKIGKVFDQQSSSNRMLNISSELLDMHRIKTLTIKGKGTTKPKILGWSLKFIGFIFIALAVGLFIKQWLWLPLIIGIIGGLLSTIGIQVSYVVDKFLTTIAFEAGIIIPGIISSVEDKVYEAIFMAPLSVKSNQSPRWGLKKMSFKKEAGNFRVGEDLAGVCVLGRSIADYRTDFIPTPICLGYRNEIISNKAKSTITNKEWQILHQIINKYSNILTSNILILDHNLQQIF